ncbi:MAG: hypothetical protein NVSMB47_04750 [Polyangiales bacterium]
MVAPAWQRYSLPMPATVLDTPIGALGLAWSARGLTRLTLPIAGDMGARLRREQHIVLESPDADAAPWVAGLLAHFAGAPDALDAIPVDDAAVTPFQRAVYHAARAIPRGTTLSYGELAAKIGSRAPRAVGVALGKNPVAIVVPCHRVVGTHDCGGFSAHGGASTKATLLAIEGGALGDPEHKMARRALIKAEPKLASLVRKVPCTLPVRPKGALFRTLVRAIAGQQLSTKAAATIFGRLERAMGLSTPGAAPSTPAPGAIAVEPIGPLQAWDELEAPRRLLALPTESLRAVGMSGSKAASLHDLARKVDDGVVQLGRLQFLTDQAIVDTLTEVRGIGRWTVEMLLIFELGRPDLLPVDDLGIQKGFQRVFGTRALPSAATIERRAEAWRPWRSIGSWYLWRALDTAIG